MAFFFPKSCKHRRGGTFFQGFFSLRFEYMLFDVGCGNNQRWETSFPPKHMSIFTINVCGWKVGSQSIGSMQNWHLASQHKIGTQIERLQFWWPTQQFSLLISLAFFQATFFGLQCCKRIKGLVYVVAAVNAFQLAVDFYAQQKPETLTHCRDFFQISELLVVAFKYLYTSW